MSTLLVTSFAQLFLAHGGGMIQGAGNMFNGSAIVAQSINRGTPIIYVNFNYRIDPLGFPQGQETVNRGLKDQVTALEWIQQNIGIFGGDMKKLTTLFLNSNLKKYARAAIWIRDIHWIANGIFPTTHKQFAWGRLHFPHPKLRTTPGNVFVRSMSLISLLPSSTWRQTRPALHASA
ncbi:hypothetical protein K443DRAFT_11797 [Laccaria amethystina LaAM-08-1]|uniref:Carboxylesterase type B domain-containing protein n=1 Tax=Laccaria amethystina LaAM-08-1 TaxID=1095629 RepID=A0A0C9XAW3_9AGAR|nr:hypothetical protein K443DRAFT_11797 [Laccaria amethystina LaAM-08-1]